MSILAMVDAVTKLLIEQGVITDAEFKEKTFRGTSRIPADSESDCAIVPSSVDRLSA